MKDPIYFHATVTLAIATPFLTIVIVILQELLK